MYWNNALHGYMERKVLINYNMRCIETEIDTSGLTKKSR